MPALLSIVATYTYELDPDALQENLDHLSSQVDGLKLVAVLFVVALMILAVSFTYESWRRDRKIKQLDHAVTGLLRMQVDEPAHK